MWVQKGNQISNLVEPVWLKIITFVKWTFGEKMINVLSNNIHLICIMSIFI